MLVSKKNDAVATLACSLIKNMLLSKPMLRYTLVQMRILPLLFSTIVPTEHVNVLIPFSEQAEKEARLKETMPLVSGFDVNIAESETSDSEAEERKVRNETPLHEETVLEEKDDEPPVPVVTKTLKKRNGMRNFQKHVFSAMHRKKSNQRLKKRQQIKQPRINQVRHFKTQPILCLNRMHSLI